MQALSLNLIVPAVVQQRVGGIGGINMVREI